MKKLSYLFLLIGIAGTLFITSCKDDDVVDPDGPPTVTAPSIQDVEIESTTDLTFSVSTPGGYQSSSVAASEGTATVSSEPSAGATSGDVVVSYTAPASEGTVTVTLTVTDNNNLTASQNAALSVSSNVPEKIVLAGSRLGLAAYEGYDETAKSYTMTTGIEYELDGFVFVNYGQTLIIQEGVIIKGNPGQGEGASALIVARGGRIEANGTAANPIIMTGTADNLNGSITFEANAMWGGLIILGTATNNECDGAVCGTNIEGIPPTTEPRGFFGYGDTEIIGPNGELVDEEGNDYATVPTDGETVTFEEDAADDSGVLNYVSVRHGGSIIGDDNEINGITFGAVGSGTEIDFIEVWSNLDDGIEFFGGTVNLKHVALGYIGDDFIDYDLGYDGHIQYAVAYQKSSTSVSSDPNFGEHDGGSSPDDATPFGSPVFSNITYIGSDAQGLQALVFYRDNAGGEIWNSIFHNANGQILIEDRDGEDSYERFLAGQPGGDGDNRIFISNNIFSDVMVGGAAATDITELFSAVEGNDLATGDVTASTTAIQDAFGPVNTLENLTFGASGTSQLVPASGGTADTGAEDISTIDSFFENAAYRGAFDPASSTTWIDGWTKLSEVIQ